MNLKKIILSFASVLFFGMAAFTQNFTNKGREFWVGYGHHQLMEPRWDNSQEMVLYLCTGDSAAVVTVSIYGSGTTLPPPAGGPWTRVYTIPPNTVVSIADPMPIGVTVTCSPTSIGTIGTIPKSGTFDARMITPAPPIGTGGEGIFQKKAIHIVSSTAIVAYEHCYALATSGATMLLPVETWGYNYTSINSKQIYNNDCFSWLYVIANTDNTVVQITPSAASRNGRPAKVPFLITLQKGEMYQLVGASFGTAEGYELTGTKVKSVPNSDGQCFPIAVFNGSSRTSNPCSFGVGGGGDNDNQQAFPEQAWGRQYLTSPTSNSTLISSFMTNMYKIVVKDPTTVVKLNGVTLTPNSDGYYYYESTKADYITADKPIMVAEFMSGGNCKDVNGVGDPEMMYISPIEQSIKKINFYRNTKYAIVIQYLTIIIPTAGLSTLKIDGVLFANIAAANKYSYPHPNYPGYSVVVRAWTAGQSQSIAESDSAFTAITYGLGIEESYGYNAGTYVSNLNAATTIHNTLDTSKKVDDFTCANSAVEICALVAYKPTQINWYFSQVPAIFPNPGDLVSGDGINLMIPSDSSIIKGRTFYKYCAPSNPYKFNAAGTFNVPFWTKNPQSEVCDPFEKFSSQVLVKARPTADFSYTYTGCPSDSVKFSGNSIGGDYTISRWFWEFPTGTVGHDSVQTPAHFFATAGTYNVKLTVATGDGCSADTTKSVIVPKAATTSFTVNNTTICDGEIVTIAPASVSTTQWYWNFGDGTSDTLLNSNPFTHVYAKPGVYTINHSIKGTGNCNPAALPITVTVYAKPYVPFTFSAGCLPANGFIQFNSNAFVTDGQAINTSSYLWNFGDAGATVANPNTSSLANPSHIFSNKTYTILYGVSTVNGCRKDTSVTTTFYLKATLSYKPLADVCLNAGAFSIDFGQATNGAAITKRYSGDGITNTLTGTFDPAVAGVGTHVIKFFATTVNGGCTDSVINSITVKSVPYAAFSTPIGCVINGAVQFTNNSTGATSYSWDFGDASAVNTTASPLHTYASSGIYIVKLTAASNGCPKDTTIKVTVNMRPQLSFPALSAVCANAPAFSIATGTVTNGVTGVSTYSGDGTNAAGIFSPATAGVGTHTIVYTFTSTAGCTDSLKQTIEVWAAPVAAFNMDKKDVCINGIVTLSDHSSVAQGTITSYNWSFNNVSDPPRLNGTPFTKIFATVGSQTVKLYVVSDSGCTSTTVADAINVHPNPIADFTLPTSVCMPNGTAMFTNGSTVADQSSLNYAWTFGDNSATSSATNPTHIYNSSFTQATVSLLATSQFGCTDVIAKPIGFYNKPLISFSISADTLCQGEPTIFTDLSGINTTRTWDFGDGSTTSALASVVKSYKNAGDYTIKLSVKNVQGCEADTLKPIKVYPQPIVDAGPSFVVPQGQLVTFSAVVNIANLNLRWAPSTGLSDPFILAPSLTVTANQIYTLTATGQGNCTASDTLTVRVTIPIVIPNVFSPNGDGINDTWQIKNLQDYPNSSIEIFDRYGRSVYTATGYPKPWDGTLQGKQLPIGVYYYIISLRDGSSPVTGSVTILK